MGTTNHSSSCGCFEPSVPFPRRLSAACTGLESQAFAMCPGGPQVRVSSMCSSHGEDACTRAWPRSKFVNVKYEWARLHMVAKIAPNSPPDAEYFMTYLSEDRAA